MSSPVSACSSTSTAAAPSMLSTPTTSTTTSASPAVATTPPRTSAPGRARCSPPPGRLRGACILRRMASAVDHRVRLAAGLSAAEVHAHTTASDGMVAPEELVAAAAAAGIAVLCVTDHDTMASTARAVEAGAEVGVEVVPGEEVTTSAPASVHVVGLFLERPVRMGMSVEDTV